MMKKASAWTLILSLCLCLFSNCVFSPVIPPDDEQEKQPLSLSSAKNLLDFFDACLYPNRKTYEKADAYFLDKDYTFSLAFSQADVEIPDLRIAETMSELPYSITYQKNGDCFYAKYVTTLYGTHYPIDTFRETQTTETYVDGKTLTVYETFESEQSVFVTYGDFEEPTVSGRDKRYVFENADLFAEEYVCYTEQGDTRNFIDDFLLRQPFGMTFDYERPPSAQIGHIVFTEETFVTEGNSVTFSLAFDNGSQLVSVTGEVDTVTGSFSMTVERAAHPNETVGFKESVYTVTLTRGENDIVFDTDRTFVESPDT